MSSQDVRYKRAGTLQLPRDTISFFMSAGSNTVRIKNLDLVPTESHHFRRYSSPRCLDYKIELRSAAGCNPPKIEQRHVQDDVTRVSNVPDSKHITDPAKAFLEAVIARPGYNGLSFKDLKHLANTLRITPRAGAGLLMVR